MLTTCCIVAVLGIGSTGSADPLATSKVWKTEHAAHLLRRAGFGGTPEQIQHLRKLGRRKAVDSLIACEETPEVEVAVRIDPHPQPLRITHPDADRDELQLLRTARNRADQRQLRRVSRWWIETVGA
jgi:hypothetical protein